MLGGLKEGKGHNGWRNPDGLLEEAGLQMGRTGWVGRRGGEMTMRGKDEEQGHAVVQSRR